MSKYIADIETNTDFSKIRLVGVYDVANDKYIESDLLSAIDFDEGDVIIMHNGVRFDLPMCTKLEGFNFWQYFKEQGVKIVDTMLLSKIIHPDIKCGHSLAALNKHYYPSSPAYWKQELPEAYPNWESFYDGAPLWELWDYLKQDLYATYMLYRALCKYMSDTFDTIMVSNIVTKVLPVEQEVAHLVSLQVEKKVQFDAKLASDVYKKLQSEIDTIEAVVGRDLPMVPMNESALHHPPKAQFKKDGTPSKRLVDYCEKYGYSVMLSWGKWQAYKAGTAGEPDVIKLLPLFEPLVTSYKLEMKNQKALKQYLMEAGWTPTYWNKKLVRDEATGKKFYEKTSPRFTEQVSKEPCPNLAKMGFKHGEAIARWAMLRARKNVLKAEKGIKTGWLNVMDENQCLPSEADTLGTNTGRFSHKIIANIPRVSTPYGEEFRSMFKAREGTTWVGWDASSLEACMEAHFVYPYDPEYAEALVSGDSSKGTDVHTRNMKSMGLPNRDVAKTFKYAVTYGAQAPKLAEQLSVSKEQAQAWFDGFWESNHGLKRYKEELIRQWKANGKKFIVGLDGRPVSTRSEHSLVNAAFQNAGAVVMKYAMLLAHKRIQAMMEPLSTMEADGLIRYHDEEQWEVTTTTKDLLAETVGEQGIRSITDAGKALKIRVPLTGEYNIGRNWKETH